MMPKEILSPQNYQLRQATLDDAPQIHDLLDLRAIGGSVLPRSVKELNLVISNTKNYTCVVVSKRRELLGFASLEVYEDPDPEKGLPGLAEVRSVAAVKDGSGFGKRAVLGVLERAREMSIGSVYCTTDNIFYFNHIGFQERRGGNQILWMNLEDKPTISASLNGTVRPAKFKDKEAIYSIIQSSPNFYPMGEKEFEHRLKSFWVFEDEKGKVLGSVCPVVYSNYVGQRPRMAEVRALSVEHNHLGQGVGMALLGKCWDIFKAKNVVQAFTTAYPGRANELVSSGFFNYMPGNKSVLWWNGTYKGNGVAP